jgi:NADPH:quinone reductase-like Zn-dependent oxidoreductase
LLPVASLGASAFGQRLGMEAAGIVVATGEGVTNFKVLFWGSATGLVGSCEK